MVITSLQGYQWTAGFGSVLPKFHQYVACAKVLDLVYTNIPSMYQAKPHLHLGYLDHMSVMLMLMLVRCSKPVQKQVRASSAEAMSALQYCFEHNDLQMFREAAKYSDSSEEYMLSVTSYNSKCIDGITVSKKLWMTAGVCELLKCNGSDFRAGEKVVLSPERAKLLWAILSR